MEEPLNEKQKFALKLVYTYLLSLPAEALAPRKVPRKRYPMEPCIMDEDRMEERYVEESR